MSSSVWLKPQEHHPPLAEHREGARRGDGSFDGVGAGCLGTRPGIGGMEALDVQRLKVGLFIPPEPQIIGALGGALIAQEFCGRI